MSRRTIDERLEKHSSLRARFEAILDIAEGESIGPDTANAVEERAIVEVRKLGQELMQEWAAGKVAKEVETHKNNGLVHLYGQNFGRTKKVGCRGL